MPSSISTVGQLVAVIRGQLSSRSDVGSNKRSGNSKTANKANAYSSANLETLIGQRIKSIERDDPNRGRKAFRVFLESIFLSHFGEQMINDPKFYQLVDDVHMSMETDDATRDLIDAAILHLLSGTA